MCLSLPPVFGWGRYSPEISGLGYYISFWINEKMNLFSIMLRILFNMEIMPSGITNLLMHLILDAPLIGILTKGQFRMLCGYLC